MKVVDFQGKKLCFVDKITAKEMIFYLTLERILKNVWGVYSAVQCIWIVPGQESV